MRSAVWWTVSVLSFVVAVASFVAALWLKDLLDSADKASSIVSGFVGLASLAVSAVSLVIAIRSGRADPVTQLNQAAEELARLVDRQWTREAGIRGLLHPEPLRVTWLSTERPVNPPAAEVLDDTPGLKPTKLRLADDVRNVASTWEQLPSRQLVVIGAPGAGKTSLAMLLVRQLLACRDSGGAVPVLLNLIGWDPDRVHLDTWLAQRLAADYPQLNAKRHYGSEAVRRLVDRRLVVPVLDGLDEMPESARPQAIAALTEVVGGVRPLVLTCRAEEYEEAIGSVGAPLARAAVVELEPVSYAEVAAYLITGLVDGDQRWAGVIKRLQDEPDGVLATALSTPLMAYLARIAYREPGADPSSLLGISEGADVERALLAAYLPTMYRSVRTKPGTPELRKYRPEQAERWLGGLAQQMARRGDESLRLWSWRSIVGLRPVRVGRAVLLFALAMSPLFQLATGTWFGPVGEALLLSVFVLATFIGLFVLMPLVSLLSIRSVVVPFRFEVSLTGAINGVAAGAVTIWTLHFAWLVSRDLMGGAPVDLFTMVLGVFVTPSGAVAALIGLLSGVLVNPAPSSGAFEPSAALSRDSDALMTVVIISMFFMVATQLLTGGVEWKATFGLLLLGVPFGALVALVLGVGVASTRWYVIGGVLVLAGVLPLRATRFIEDAHKRGVLRVVGMEYQFRHAKIQAHLASL